MSLIGLMGCANAPTASGAQPVTAEEEILVGGLHCPKDGLLVVAGQTLSLSSRRGVVLYSEDRGVTWRHASFDPGTAGVALGLVKLPDGKGGEELYATGYRSGENVLSEIASSQSLEPGPWWTTSDGGRSWNRTEPRLPLPRTKGFGSGPPGIVVADEKGTLVSVVQERDSVALLRSADGGKHWDRQELPKLNLFNGIAFDRRGHLVLVGIESKWSGPSGLIYRSDDAGATWSESPAPYHRVILYRTSGGALLALNTDQKSGARALIYHSPDNGRTWARPSDLSGTGVVTTIDEDAGGRIVAVTEYGYVLISDDGGVAWRKAGKATEKDVRSMLFREMAFSDVGVVVALVGNGTIVRSTDRGETWSTADSRLPDGEHLGALCTDRNGLIVAIGRKAITRSTDWGKTWQRSEIARGSP